MATIFNPKITEAGLAAALNAQNTGVELALTHVAFGIGSYTPVGSETALVSEVKRVPIAAGSRITPTQIRITSIWSSDIDASPINEIGFYAGSLLFAVWSRATGGPLGYKSAGVDFVLPYDWTMTAIPPNTITVVADAGQSAYIAMLGAHENNQNAHPQYLKRADVAKAASTLIWAGTATGTANALLLDLPVESVIPSYVEGQRFIFKAGFENTGAVTVNVEGLGVKSIKKNGSDNLIAGDVKLGAVFELIYDGTNFQIVGGVGGGKTFEQYAYTASAGQTDFNAVYLTANVIFIKNGRTLTRVADFIDTSQTYCRTNIPCVAGDSILILAYNAFSVANTYTKSEMDALMTAMSAIPVGAVIPMTIQTVPPGMLEADGSVKAQAVYPDLFAAIGTAYNTGGEGAGNFRLPDYRGEFLRGWDHGRGVDAGRALGSKQKGSFTNVGSGPTADLVTNYSASAGSATFVDFGLDDTTLTDYPNIIATYATPTGSQPPSRSDASYGLMRPRNLSVMWCIKAWNAPVNQGNIDIAALQDLVLAASTANVQSYRGLVVTANGLNSNIQIYADELIVRNGAGASKRLDNTFLTINLASVGANGVDTGVVAASLCYSIWVAWNSSANTVAGVAALAPVLTGNTTAGSGVITALSSTASMRIGMPLSGGSFPSGAVVKSVDSASQVTSSLPAVSTATGVSIRFVYDPVMPAGYTHKMRVSSIFTDATTKYALAFEQIDCIGQYKPLTATNTPVLPVMATGIIGNPTSGPSWAPISVAAFVPPTARRITVVAFGQTSCAMAPNTNYGTTSSATNSPPWQWVPPSTTSKSDCFSMALESAFIYGGFSSAASSVSCLGWEDRL